MTATTAMTVRADRPRGFFKTLAPRFAAMTAACGVWASAGAGEAMSPNTSNGYNLPPGVTEMSRAIYDLHMEAFWICVIIAVVVFSAMIYSLVKFRHSQGAVPDTSMLHSTKVEIAWTIDEKNERLRLTWTETGGPEVQAPTRRSFGTRMIETLGKQLNGEVEMIYAPEGLVYALNVPLNSLKPPD